VQSTEFRELSGKTGGITSHNHSYVQLPSHTHGITDPGHSHTHTTKSFGTGPFASQSTPDPSYAFSYDLGSYVPSMENKVNLNILTSGTSEIHSTTNCSELPPFIRIPFIMKVDDNSLIPAGLIVFWAQELSTLPEEWIVCNGSQGTTNLTNFLMLGTNNESQIREVGGSATHQHSYGSLPYHAHAVSQSGHLHNGNIPDIQKKDVTTAGGTYSTFLYFDSYTHETSESVSGISLKEFGSDVCITLPSSNYPPYVNLIPIMKNSSINMLPANCIVMWAKDLHELPDNTLLCDGLNGSPNLYGKFIRSVDLEGEINLTGGSTLHYHRYLGIPRHTHEVSETPHTHDIYYQSNNMHQVLTAGSGAYISLNTQSVQVLQSVPSGVLVNFSGDNYCTTDTLNILPPYYRLSFIMTENDLIQSPWKEGKEKQNISGYSIPLLLICLGVALFITTGNKIKRKL
jgi:microcystin-dependent protein